jgi:hypothetical protein
MFRAKTTRRNTKRAISPLRPTSDPTATQAPPPPNTIIETSVSVAPLPVLQEKQMTDLFAAEAASVSLTKPWLRLERGIRMQKLKTFADTYDGLSVEDKDNLYKYLIRANDAKLLNTKQQIQYEHGIVQAIKGLKIIRTGNPTEAATFKIEITRATKRNSVEDK